MICSLPSLGLAMLPSAKEETGRAGCKCRLCRCLDSGSASPAQFLSVQTQSERSVSRGALEHLKSPDSYSAAGDGVYFTAFWRVSFAPVLAVC